MVASNGGVHLSMVASNGGVHLSMVASNGGVHLSMTASNGGAHLSMVASNGGVHLSMVASNGVVRLLSMVASNGGVEVLNVGGEFCLFEKLSLNNIFRVFGCSCTWWLQLHCSITQVNSGLLFTRKNNIFRVFGCSCTWWLQLHCSITQVNSGQLHRFVLLLVGQLTCVILQPLLSATSRPLLVCPRPNTWGWHNINQS